MTDETTPEVAPAKGWLGHPLVRHESIDSTNREAWRHAEAGAGHGLVVVAERQTAGRGRRERTWHSPAGEGVYASALLRPGVLEAGAGLLGIAAGIAAAEAVEDVGVPRARIKWPNDVYVDGRKIAGILTEAHDAGTPEGSYVVGVGINVGQTSFPDGLRAPATSIRMATGTAPTCGDVLDRLLSRLEPWVDALVAGRLAALEGAFEARDHLTGRRISFSLSGAMIEGEVLSISPLRGLLLRADSGEERTFPPDHVSEVTILDGESA